MAELRQPLEFQRAEVVYHIHFGGHVDHVDDRGRDRATWRPAETVQAVAYDTPIVGWRGQHVNALRLWSARSPDPLRLDVFNSGDYLGAVAEEARAELICKFLYPNDENSAGRELPAAAGIFLRLGFAAGPDQAAPRFRRAVAQPPLQGRGATQRHPSEPRRHRADAHPGRPAQFPLGRSVEAYGGGSCPTPITRCCRKRWRPGRSNCSSGCCRGISKSSTASMPRIWRWPMRAARAMSISAPRCR